MGVCVLANVSNCVCVCLLVLFSLSLFEWVGYVLTEVEAAHAALAFTHDVLCGKFVFVACTVCRLLQHK